MCEPHGRQGHTMTQLVEDSGQAAQAAIWHLTDKMSWQSLREKRQEQWGAGEPVPYFSEAQVDEAENLIRQVQEKVDSLPRRSETAAR